MSSSPDQHLNNRWSNRQRNLRLKSLKKIVSYCRQIGSIVQLSFLPSFGSGGKCPDSLQTINSRFHKLESSFPAEHPGCRWQWVMQCKSQKCDVETQFRLRSPRREPSEAQVTVKARPTQIITDSDPGPRLVSQAHKLQSPPSPPILQSQPPALIGAVLLKNVNNLFKNLLN